MTVTDYARGCAMLTVLLLPVAACDGEAAGLSRLAVAMPLAQRHFDVYLQIYGAAAVCAPAVSAND